MCQHLCFVLFLISRRFLLFGCCAINRSLCVRLSLILSFFSPSLSLSCTLCCMWLPQGVKGQPGEKVSPHFPLFPSALWTQGLSEAPAQPSRWHAHGAELPAGPAGPQPLTPSPNSFHTIRLGSWDSWAEPQASWQVGPPHQLRLPLPVPGALTPDLRPPPFPEARSIRPCLEWDAASCPPASKHCLDPSVRVSFLIPSAPYTFMLFLLPSPPHGTPLCHPEPRTRKFQAAGPQAQGAGPAQPMCVGSAPRFQQLHPGGRLCPSAAGWAAT